MRVKQVDYLKDYMIKLLFNDDQIKIVDLEDELWGSIYEPLKDINYFKQVTVDRDSITIQWPNGEDFSPDVLYELGVEEKTGKRLRAKSMRTPHNPQRRLNRKAKL